MRVHHGADAADTGDRVEQHAGPVSRGDDGPHTRPRGDAGGGHLRRHAAAAPQRARSAHLFLERSIDADHLFDQRCVRVEARVGGEHAGGVGEHDQQVRPDEMRDERGQTVVVAEADLVVGNRVVLVHDWHGAELEEAGERLSGVEVLTALDEVVRHEQHLCGNQAVSGENVVVRAHEPALAGRGEGLERRQIDGSLGETQGGDPCRHRARRHDDHVVAVDAELCDLVTELLDRLNIDRAGAVRDRRRADLRDDPAHGALNGQARSRS